MGKIKKFICTECRSEYISGNDTVPHLVMWYDGHVCVPKLYAEQDDKRIKKIKVGVEDDIWTTWYN
jgi:stringent starvation protein B|tara:strand:- start:462 stop:659 length:198 start_codon:yes stop_codon:yes gene_type:complete